MMPNPTVNLTAQQLRCWVRSALARSAGRLPSLGLAMNRRHLYIFSILIISSTCCYAQRSGEAEAECYTKESSHVQSIECLESLAKKSEEALKNAEDGMIKSIKTWDEDTDYKSSSLSAFLEAKKQFQKYMGSQCNFVHSLAAGGNGGIDRFYLCTIELESKRIDELKATSESIK